MHPFTLARALLATCFLASTASASAKDTVSVATPINFPHEATSFSPTHVIAWEEQARDQRIFIVYLTEQAIPEAVWLDAENRNAALMRALEAANSRRSIWRIGAEGLPSSIMQCSVDGACAGEGVNVINDIATARSTLQAADGRLRGALETGNGVCGQEWCSVTASIEIDTTLAPPPLLLRVVEQGATDHAEADTVKAELTAYWKAAGKAKRSADLEPFFTAERMAEGERQSADDREWAERAFVQFFVPAHAGKLDVQEIRVLDAAAVAHIKTRSSGEDAQDMECRVLLRKQGGAWKVGPEEC